MTLAILYWFLQTRLLHGTWGKAPGTHPSSALSAVLWGFGEAPASAYTPSKLSQHIPTLEGGRLISY